MIKGFSDDVIAETEEVLDSALDVAVEVSYSKDDTFDILLFRSNILEGFDGIIRSGVDADDHLSKDVFTCINWFISSCHDWVSSWLDHFEDGSSDDAFDEFKTHLKVENDKVVKAYAPVEKLAREIYIQTISAIIPKGTVSSSRYTEIKEASIAAAEAFIF
jgi:hypothetical protein